MTQLPSYDQWMASTYSRTRKRSEFLVALDDSLKAPQIKENVKVALDRWIFDQKSKAKDWRESVRNSKGAVTELYRAVYDNRNLSKEEIEAMDYIGRQQKLALCKQFEGKKLSFKSNNLVGMYQQRAKNKMDTLKLGLSGAKTVGTTTKSTLENISGLVDVAGNGGKIASNAADAAKMKKNIENLLKNLCPGKDPDKVLKGLGLGGTSKFTAEVMPVVGLVTSGGKAVIGWIGVAKTVYDKKGMTDSRYAFAPEDPSAAFDAILTLLNREIASKTVAASKSTVAFTGKTLGFFCDAGAVTGPVVGLLELLAEIIQTIVEYVRDLLEVDRANELLRIGYLNLDLFRVCPILGCYYLVIQDHSTIINMAVADYGSPQFVFDSEKLINKVRPVLERSRTYIQESRFEIANMEKAKGIATENWAVKGKLDQLKSLPGHVVESLGEKVQELRGKGQHKVTVDPSRIYGYGHIRTGFGRNN
ncbi:hypothetical protein [uncultured Cocleimonas sp.]|uniref:hypothetical protein n=1 Tax=uncultured Cocleimonas sp. TaxID=1051587 RepID=UPI0026276E19|nr:hypothetical protein [uncultured Cocleimonas sp.]